MSSDGPGELVILVVDSETYLPLSHLRALNLGVLQYLGLQDGSTPIHHQIL
jgi:hypothetical protein